MSSGWPACVCAGQANLESQILLQDQLKLSGIAFYGVAAEQQHDSAFAIEADRPAVLVGGDAAP